MGSEHDTDALEALARGQHVVDRAALDAHLATCDECARELAWLRAEQRIFRERDVDAPSTEALWRGVASKLPSAPTANLSPYRIAAPPPPVVARRPWRAFAAGFMAAALLGVGVAALTLKVNSTPARPRALSHDVNQPRRERPDLHADASLSVSGPRAAPPRDVVGHGVTGVEQNELRATVRVATALALASRASPTGATTPPSTGVAPSSGEVEVTLPRVFRRGLDGPWATSRWRASSATRASRRPRARCMSNPRDAEVTSTGDVARGDGRERSRPHGLRRPAHHAARAGAVGRHRVDLGRRGVDGLLRTRMHPRRALGVGERRPRLRARERLLAAATTVSGEISDTLATGVATPVGEGSRDRALRLRRRRGRRDH
ncbi:MAG: hypothetical protein U0326_29115 [Polyangiales bacterium]